MGSHSLDGKSVLSLTRSLMQIESTSGSETDVAKALELWFKSQGWNCHRQYLDESSKGTFNVLLIPPGAPIWAPGNAGPDLILNTHMDTVPPFIAPRFDAETGILYGRGSNDAKGQIAVIAMAAINLPKDIQENVGILLVCEEETTHKGALSARRELNLRPKAVICGEPTEGTLATAQKGILKVKVKSTGIEGHSGYPHLCDSAVETLLDFIQALRNCDLPSHPEFGETSMNIGLIQGGVAANVIPGSAEALLMFRVVGPPEVVMSILDSHANPKLTFEWLTSNDPFILNTKPAFKQSVVAFNTDLPYFGFPRHETDCYLMGPGSITNAHSDMERITEQELEDGVTTLMKLILKIFKDFETQ